MNSPTGKKNEAQCVFRFYGPTSVKAEPGTEEPVYPVPDFLWVKAFLQRAGAGQLHRS